ncbi:MULTISPECIES: HK97 family phage prohead protease [unclassified Ensifer]|uniref:HK97 family phage prohead protease n=1 Tax=unclassified Ensifer TaxID=2633371 RepID=UPI00081374A6|nr:MULTISPECIES: HK97 family phage prohead protease [unclassified Ensifer]OCO99788.1 phage prohead protein [Ensifer sp. LC14]OCP06130.1 phage prohead protein [Ensifer sp. LC11]OCP07079.1 phage prohead protein [Ensifer sp. LC13]OCP31467.1 phage prohead protein [Ensifer sp. LC499]
MTERISGHAATFNSPTTIAGEFREMLAPGCFTRTLKDNPDVLMVLDHDFGRILGRTTAGTLELKEDRTGLWFSLIPDPSTPSGQEAIGTVRRGDVKGCSFSFRVRAERWEDGGDRLPLRILEDVDLYEVTLTAAPAYPSTTASLRVDGSPNAKASAFRGKAEAAMLARGIPLT